MDDGVVLEVEVADDVALPVGVTDAVGLALIVDDGDVVGETVALNDIEGVLLAVSPKERVLVGVTVIVEESVTVVDPLSLLVGVCVGVCDDVLVPLVVDEPVPLTEALIVVDGESVAVSLPVSDGPAPTVTDAVGENEIDLERL